MGFLDRILPGDTFDLTLSVDEAVEGRARRSDGEAPRRGDPSGPALEDAGAWRRRPSDRGGLCPRPSMGGAARRRRVRAGAAERGQGAPAAGGGGGLGGGGGGAGGGPMWGGGGGGGGGGDSITSTFSVGAGAGRGGGQPRSDSRGRRDRGRQPVPRLLSIAEVSESLPGRVEIVDLGPLSQGEIERCPEGFVDALFGWDTSLMVGSNLKKGRLLRATLCRWGRRQQFSTPPPPSSSGWWRTSLTSNGWR